MDQVWDVLFSFGPSSFVEPSVHAHIWGSRLLMDSCRVSFECLRGMLLETCSRGVLASVDSVLSDGHRLSDADPPFFVGGFGKELSNNFLKSIFTYYNFVKCHSMLLSGVLWFNSHVISLVFYILPAFYSGVFFIMFFEIC